LDGAIVISQPESVQAQMLEYNLDAALLTGLDGTVLYANAAACALFGYNPDEFRALDHSAVVDTSDPRLTEALRQHRKTGRFQGVLTMQRKDGSRFSASVSSVVYTDISGEQRSSTVVRDITRQEQREAALQVREKQLADSQRIAHIGSWEHDMTTGHVTWSDEMFGLLGLDPETNQADFQIFFDMVHPDDRMSIRKATEETIQLGKPYSIEYRLVSRDGTARIIHAQAELFRDSAGKQVILSGTAQDITQRKRTEERLRESEERHKTILHTAMDGFWRLDMQGRLLEVNATYCRMSGYSEQELLAMSIPDLEAAEIPAETAAHIQKVLGRGEDRFETWHRRKDGSAFPIEISTQYKPAAEGYLVVFLRDITERKQTEDALLGSREELRALADRLIVAREEENKRLARELHDAVSQRLAVLGMDISALELALTSDSAKKSLQQMGEQIGQLAQEIHELSRQMHPSFLYDLGLRAALQAECVAFSKQHRTTVKFVPTSVPDSLPADISLSVYRIAQESLWNIAKHARARNIRLALSQVDGELVLTVEDDGAGFDQHQIKGKGSLGFVSMEERSRLVQGTFSVQSKPGKGTKVEARIPLPLPQLSLGASGNRYC
jgi:PAS domain S-box-containing protein